jgi:hypothetical protein
MIRHTSLIALAMIAGCSTHSTMTSTPDAPKPVPMADKSQCAALIDRVKQLDGTWSVPPHEGAPGGTIVFSTTSAGSAVREIMLPGTPMEMTNVYHMDGTSMVMTHYCAMGNQPHLRATAGKLTDPIVLKCDGVSNMASADQEYMGELMITFIDHNHVRETWTSFKSGRAEGEHASFDLTRTK